MSLLAAAPPTSRPRDLFAAIVRLKRERNAVLAGVYFMAETAKILNPQKRVLLPDVTAGCSLSDSCQADDFAAFKAAHPDHVVVSYVNTSAAIKALSDYVCTSSNATAIVRSIPQDKPIIFCARQEPRPLRRPTNRPRAFTVARQPRRARDLQRETRRRATRRAPRL